MLDTFAEVSGLALWPSVLHRHSSGILYPWTGSGKMVHTGTYQYVPVQHGISQYENSTVVRTGMYRYILVRTFNKTGCFLIHAERVRRDKIKVVQILCMGYNVTRPNFKTAQVETVELIASTYWYILVHTGIYWYIQVQSSTTRHTSFDHALSALRPLRVSAERLA